MKSLFVSKIMIFCLILIAGFMLGPSDASAAPIGPCVDLQCDCQDDSICSETCTFTVTNCSEFVAICEYQLTITITDPPFAAATVLGDNLLAPLNNNCDALSPGESMSFVQQFFSPGVYAYSAIVTATDAAGGIAENICDGTFSVAMCVPADIKPMSCPNPLSLMNKGVLPVAILGTPEFDATTIDPVTIQLEGVAPLRWSVMDVTAPYIGDANDDCMSCAENGEDGYDDLTLKFDAQEVIAALGDVTDGQCLVVELTGNLKAEFGGTPISAQDVLLIIDNE